MSRPGWQEVDDKLSESLTNAGAAGGDPSLRQEVAQFIFQQGTKASINYHNLDHYLLIGRSLDDVKGVTLEAQGLAMVAGLMHDVRQIFHGVKESYLGVPPDMNSQLNILLADSYKHAAAENDGKLVSDEEISRTIAVKVGDALGLKPKQQLRVGLYIEATKHFFGQNSVTSLLAYIDNEAKALGIDPAGITPEERKQYIIEARAVVERDIGNFIDPNVTPAEFYQGTTQNTYENAALFESIRNPNNPKPLNRENWMAQVTPMDLAVGLKPNTVFMGMVANSCQVVDHRADRATLEKGAEASGVWANDENALVLDYVQNKLYADNGAAVADQEALAKEKAGQSRDTNTLIMGAAIIVAAVLKGSELEGLSVAQIVEDPSLLDKIMQRASAGLPEEKGASSLEHAQALTTLDAAAQAGEAQAVLTQAIIEAVGIERVLEAGRELVAAKVTGLTPEEKYASTTDYTDKSRDSWVSKMSNRDSKKPMQLG